MKVWSLGLVSNHCNTVYLQVCHLFASSHFYYRFTKPCFTTDITRILSSLRWTSASIQLTIVLGVLRTQEKHHNTTPPTVLWPLMLLTSFTKCFSGVAELTTQLLRLIGILWLPLCRINKLGHSYPRRLLRSPILVGYQDCFLAPLPGSIALSISSLGKYTLAFLLVACFYFH